jgi:hypothetical protein
MNVNTILKYMNTTLEQHEREYHPEIHEHHPETA